MFKIWFALLTTSYLALLTFQSAVADTADKKNHLTFSDPSCDDGKTNLTVDWDESNYQYTCFQRIRWIPNPWIKSILRYDPAVKTFKAKHFCMNTKIVYKKVLPTYGDHRPIWAHFGEYKFIPPQRGLHNLEHGAIVALFHPCANQNEIQKLKSLVKGCLRRHIITPYKGLTKIRPFALLSWGWSLQMNFVDTNKAIKFIRDHAITHAPENVGIDGKYDYAIIDKPKQTDLSDKVLCPNAKLNRYDN